MIKLGITGGIGSGKTVVSKILNSMHIPVYISDEEAKRLMIVDPIIIAGLKKMVGEEAYLEDGSLNKGRIAEFLFSSPENARRINSLIHPRVRVDFEQWVNYHADYSVVAIESAILFESKLDHIVDFSVLVYADQETRIERTMRRDSSSLASVKKRILAQSKESEKIGLADFIIYNDKTSLLIPQVLLLLSEINK